MILAKPLKAKGLGRLPAVPDSTEPGSNQNQNTIKLESNYNQDLTRKFIFIGDKRYDLIFYIIRDGNGLTINEIYNIAFAFCKKCNIIWDTLDTESVRYVVKKLEAEEKITRIYIKGILHFFKKV